MVSGTLTALLFTRSATHTSQAAIKVFDVNELLEAVLLNLPFQDMFKAKAVCKSWKALIDSSPELRRAMFLAPSGSIIQPMKDEAHCGPSNIYNIPNALQSKAFEPLPMFTITERPFCEKDYVPTSWEHHIFESPLPKHLDSARMKHTFRWKIDEEKMLAVPTACRHMYLTQPPVFAVTLSLKRLASHWANIATITDKRGITIGLIADVVEKVLQQLPPSMRQRARPHQSPYVCVGFRVPEASKKPPLQDEA